MDVQENTTMAIMQRISNPLGAVRQQEAKRIANHYVEALSIATPGLTQTVRTSGADQQE
ncbi:MAG: hypothetical protein U0401_32745 [Anaerolineae bacterium]